MSGGVETLQHSPGGGGGCGLNIGGNPEGGGREEHHLHHGSNKEEEDSVNKLHHHIMQKNNNNNNNNNNGNNGNMKGGGGGGRRSRKHHHHLKKHFHHRIRRNTQPAPNNTNEFLMQEHDHLFHLDFDNNEPHSHPQMDFGSSDLDPASASFGSGSGGGHMSSSEDDQDYLSREFSATYDTVNAERLNSMTKAELIQEYQVLQERVELLERRLKVAMGYNNNDVAMGNSNLLGGMDGDGPPPPTLPTPPQ